MAARRRRRRRPWLGADTGEGDDVQGLGAEPARAHGRAHRLRDRGFGRVTRRRNPAVLAGHAIAAARKPAVLADQAIAARKSGGPCKPSPGTMVT